MVVKTDKELINTLKEILNRVNQNYDKITKLQKMQIQQGKKIEQLLPQDEVWFQEEDMRNKKHKVPDVDEYE
jgi:hypothetical protein